MPFTAIDNQTIILKNCKGFVKTFIFHIASNCTWFHIALNCTWTGGLFLLTFICISQIRSCRQPACFIANWAKSDGASQATVAIGRWQVKFFLVKVLVLLKSKQRPSDLFFAKILKFFETIIWLCFAEIKYTSNEYERFYLKLNGSHGQYFIY